MPLINALNMVVVQRLIFAVDRRDTAAVDQHLKFLCLYTKFFFLMLYIIMEFFGVDKRIFFYLFLASIYT